MEMDAIKGVIDRLDSEIGEEDLGSPVIGKAEKVHALSGENFHKIPEKASDRKIGFIDGGNYEIVGAPNFSVQLNRVYFCIFHGRRKLKYRSLEFLSATFSSYEGGEIVYNTSLHPTEKGKEDLLPRVSDLSFRSFDRTVISGTFRADIERVASIARRFAEWRYARHAMEEEMGEGDILVLDGTLQTAFTNEDEYTNRAYSAAGKNGVILSGLAKASHSFTDTGLPLLGAVKKLSDIHGLSRDSWYYHPLAEISEHGHKASLFAVKLNPEAKRVFRYEVYRPQAEDMTEDELKEVLFKLAENSKDITFPGYPYGLLDAHANGRVTREDIDRFKMKFLSEVSKDRDRGEKFLRHMLSSDAHDVLDELVGGVL